MTSTALQSCWIQAAKLWLYLTTATVGVAPHSLRAVTPEQLKQITVLANGGLCTFTSLEQTQEVEDCIAWSGQRPVNGCLRTTISMSAGVSSTPRT